MTRPLATEVEVNMWVDLFMKTCTSKTKEEWLYWLAELNQLDAQYDFKTEVAR